MPGSHRNLVIFVPGFKGTTLADADGDRVWITARVAVFRGATLALPQPLLGIENERLTPEGVLDDVTMVPFLYSYDVYGKFLDGLQERLGADYDVIPFPYDWRQDNESTLAALARVVDVERANGRPTISLIGHSMGGLIVTHYLRHGANGIDTRTDSWQGAEKVDNAVVAGAPLLGSQDMFHDFEFGDDYFGDDLLSPLALASFHSCYQLLPVEPDGFIKGHPEMKVLDPSVWSRLRWGGLYHDGSPPASRASARDQFLDSHLRRAGAFFDAIHRPTTATRRSARVLEVRGVNRATRGAVPLTKDGLSVNFERVEIVDGDGVVSAESSRIPSPYRAVLDVEELKTDSSHLRIFEDDATLGGIVAFLRGR